MNGSGSSDPRAKDRRHRATEAAFNNVLTENSNFRIQLHDHAIQLQELQAENVQLKANLEEAKKPKPPVKKKPVAKAVSKATGNGTSATA